jgi:hypothetical protein
MYTIALLRYRRPLEEVLTEGARETRDRIRDEDPYIRPVWCSTSCCRGRRTLGRRGWIGCKTTCESP